MLLYSVTQCNLGDPGTQKADALQSSYICSLYHMIKKKQCHHRHKDTTTHILSICVVQICVMQRWLTWSNEGRRKPSMAASGLLWAFAGWGGWQRLPASHSPRWMTAMLFWNIILRRQSWYLLWACAFEKPYSRDAWLCMTVTTCSGASFSWHCLELMHEPLPYNTISYNFNFNTSWSSCAIRTGGTFWCSG